LTEDKLERLAIANRIILEIAVRGRKFFFNLKDADISHFYLNDNNKLFFYDKQTKEAIYPYNHGNHYHFSEGGTLWGLINDLRYYIITGEKSNGKYGYGGLYNQHWGYENEDMEVIRNVAKELGYL
jgi:hypothetical protein